jgi:hypothetical protein
MTRSDALPDVTAWRALSVEEIRRAFSSIDAPWWIGGGWAIDLFVGSQTRPHGDIDVAMLRRDALAVRALRDAFDVYIAHDGTLTPWDGGPLGLSRHQFWARRRDDDAWAFEVLFEEESDGEWLFRRDARVRLPLARFGRTTAGGVPYVAPEVALLYKAKHDDIDRHAADFASALPLLDAGQRAWLREALIVVHPGHPWIALIG